MDNWFIKLWFLELISFWTHNRSRSYNLTCNYYIFCSIFRLSGTNTDDPPGLLRLVKTIQNSTFNTSRLKIQLESSISDMTSRN